MSPQRIWSFRRRENKILWSWHETHALKMLKRSHLGLEKMAQWLRALSALSRGPEFDSKHQQQTTHFHLKLPQGHWHHPLTSMDTHIHMADTQSQIISINKCNKNKIFKISFKNWMTFSRIYCSSKPQWIAKLLKYADVFFFSFFFFCP